MRRVLIFWIWFQWSKYINFFNKKWFIIDVVTKSWKNKKNILNINKVFHINEVLLKDTAFLNNYSNIILAINPIVEQEKVIKFLLSKDVRNKVIIEKPVSYNLELLKILKEKNNFYYFIDEIILANTYKKIFYKEIKKLVISFYKSKNYIDILEHIFSPFLLFKNFSSVIKSNINLRENNDIINFLKYTIIYNDKLIINFDKWVLTINKRFFYDIKFWKSLEYILSLKEEYNLLLKDNFIKLREYLNNLMKYNLNVWSNTFKSEIYKWKDFIFLDDYKPFSYPKMNSNIPQKINHYKFVKDYLKKFDKESKILEIGCFIWLFIDFLIKSWFKNITWIEKKEKYVFIWRKYWNLPIYEWDIYNDNLSIYWDNDILIMLWVLHNDHWENEYNDKILSFSLKILNNCRKLLKNEWILIFSTHMFFLEKKYIEKLGYILLSFYLDNKKNKVYNYIIKKNESK